MQKKYQLIPINKLDKSIQIKILNIRNESKIRLWMLNDNIINTEEHFSWIDSLNDDNSQICFAIIDNSFDPIGVITVKKIDLINKTAEIGFYKSFSSIDKGLLTKCLYCLIDYIFLKLKIFKIYSEVIEGNLKSLAIHKKLYFKEEGFLSSHIVRSGTRKGIFLFGLFHSDWDESKDSIILIDNFSIEILYV